MPVVYPEQHPTEFPEVPIEAAVDGDTTEDPDAESVVIVSEDTDNNATRDETTEENDAESNNEAIDDSITVDAYRFGGEN